MQLLYEAVLNRTKTKAILALDRGILKQFENFSSDTIGNENHAAAIEK